MKRREKETYENYRSRRIVLQRGIKQYLRGRYFNPKNPPRKFLASHLF